MIPDDKLPYHPAPPDDTAKNKRAFLPILKPLGPDDGIKFPPKNFRRNFVKLWPAVYPSRMAPFGLKLWENAFQTIPNISFFDAEKKKLAKIFDENFYRKFSTSKNEMSGTV